MQPSSHDAHRVIEYMTDGATYHASVGPDLYGRTHRARAKVPEGVRRFFDRILTPLPRHFEFRGRSDPDENAFRKLREP
jgi:hypothetical protein